MTDKSGSNTLSNEQIAELAQVVAEGVAGLGISELRAPAMEQYRLEPIEIGGRVAHLSIDVDFGEFVLKLLSTKGEVAEFNVQQLALLILWRIREVAVTRVARAANIAKARSMLQRSLERQGAGISLVDLQPEAEFISSSLRGKPFQLVAGLNLLDDALNITLQSFEARNGREFVKIVTCAAPAQRRRLRQIERLRARGAVLEIEALAERAILAAGRTVGEVAAQLLDAVGERQAVVLAGTRRLDPVTVCIRDGCIVSSVALRGVGHLWSTRLTIDSDLPETVAMALIGKPASAIVDHASLRGPTRIHKVDITSPGQTFVFLKRQCRLVMADEINGSAMAA